MPAVYVTYNKTGKETPDQRQHIIRNVMAFGAPNDQRRTIVASCIRIFEWKVTHMIKTCCEYLDRYAKLHSLSIK